MQRKFLLSSNHKLRIERIFLFLKEIKEVEYEPR